MRARPEMTPGRRAPPQERGFPGRPEARSLGSGQTPRVALAPLGQEAALRAAPVPLIPAGPLPSRAFSHTGRASQRRLHPPQRSLHPSPTSAPPP